MKCQVSIGNELDHARIAAVTAMIVIGVCSAPAAAQTAYVNASAADSVALLDTSSATVMGTLPVGDSPTRVEVTRDGMRAYVSNTAADSLSVIDTSSGAVVSTIAVGDQPSALAIAPDGARVYVSVANGVVDVVDVALGSVVASIATSGSSGQLAVTPWDPLESTCRHASLSIL